MSLTGQDGGHQCAEQDERECEEQLAGVVVDVLGLVPDVVVQDADQHAEQDVRYETGQRQHLKNGGSTASSGVHALF